MKWISVHAKPVWMYVGEFFVSGKSAYGLYVAYSWATLVKVMGWMALAGTGELSSEYVTFCHIYNIYNIYRYIYLYIRVLCWGFASSGQTYLVIPSAWSLSISGVRVACDYG